MGAMDLTGDMINFEVSVGTEMTQTVVAPGNLIREWKDNDRKYFHYRMNQPMVNFYSIVSARYQTYTNLMGI